MLATRRGFFGGLAALLVWSKRKPPLDPHYVYKGGLRGLHDDGTQFPSRRFTNDELLRIIRENKGDIVGEFRRLLSR